ncbi:MAG TPA: AAA family ATPase, partial [Thermaerobacter sp.]
GTGRGGGAVSRDGKKIVRVVLEDFQSHAHSELRPAPGLTVIVGPSDAGKSAILRALRWVYTNQPSGTEMIRAGASRARVRVELADGTAVTRERSASVNRYILERPGEDPVVFEGFGREVPAEIQEALGIRPVILGGQPVWLGYGAQLDGPFLLDAPGSYRAEAIGRLTGVHLLQVASAEAARDEQAARRKQKALAEQLEEARRELEAFADLDAEEERVRQLEALAERARGLREQADRLLQLRAALQNCRAAMAESETLLARYQGAEQAADAVRRATELSRQLGLLVEIRARLEANRQDFAETAAVIRRTVRADQAAQAVARAQQALERHQALVRYREALARCRHALQAAWAELRRWSGAAAAESRLEQARETWDRLARLRDLRQRLQQYWEAHAIAVAAVETAQKRVAAAESAYASLLLEAGTCPTCGQPVRAEALAAHLSRMAGHA